MFIEYQAEHLKTNENVQGNSGLGALKNFLHLGKLLHYMSNTF